MAELASWQAETALAPKLKQKAFGRIGDANTIGFIAFLANWGSRIDLSSYTDSRFALPRLSGEDSSRGQSVLWPKDLWLAIEPNCQTLPSGWLVIFIAQRHHGTDGVIHFFPSATFDRSKPIECLINSFFSNTL